MAVPPLDPDAAARVASFGIIGPMRQRGLATVRQAVEAAPPPDTMPNMAAIEDCNIPGRRGPIPLRIYRPHLQIGQPVLVYFHGGGMVMGSNRSFEALARALPRPVRTPPWSTVDYRLAPENPPPAQFDDAYDATHVGHRLRRPVGRGPGAAGRRRGQCGRFVGGRGRPACRDHAGPTHLRPGVALPRRQPRYGCRVDHRDARCADAHPRRHSLHARSRRHGAGPEPGPYRIPAHAPDLSGLPQAIVVTAECDPIRDWGERYATRLRDARVQVNLTRYPGIYHGFLMRSDATARGRLAIAEVCALLRAKFCNPVKF